MDCFESDENCHGSIDPRTGKRCESRKFVKDGKPYTKRTFDKGGGSADVTPSKKEVARRKKEAEKRVGQEKARKAGGEASRDPAKLVRGGGVQDGLEALAKALAAPRPSNDGLALAMADSARSSADAMTAAAREEAEGSVKAAQILAGDGLVYFLYSCILSSILSSILPVFLYSF